MQFPAFPLRVGSVTPKSPAEAAGIQTGDVGLGLRLDGEKISASRFTKLANERVNQPISLSIKRGAETKEIAVTPLFETTNKKSMYRHRLGLRSTTYQGGTIWARLTLIYPRTFGIRLSNRCSTMVNTFAALVPLPKSELSIRWISADRSASGRIYFHLLSAGEQGWRLALWFSVFMNVNLAIMNMLPIPVLDGGHIMLSLVEAVRRRPLSLRVLEWVQTSCAVVIIGFIALRHGL